MRSTATRRPNPRRRALALTLVASLGLAAACSDDADPGAGDAVVTTEAPAPADPPTTVATPDGTDDTDGTGTGTGTDDDATVDDPAEAGTVDARLDEADVRPGTEQVTITGAAAGGDVELVASDGTVVAAGVVDELGSLLFRELDGGESYVVRSAGFDAEPVTTFDRDDHPDAAFYAGQQVAAPGFGYLTTRDGTTLSATVWLPGPVDAGPYPTVVEYSGYTPSDPDSSGFGDIFTALGYAYVGVNMRGTGCSGGSYRYFEYAQSLDGYDAIETIAAQPWVLGNRVGMVGVSYPGISQLFVAQTQPPSLAAITPLSVLDDSFGANLYPGGILNTGFAVEWTEDRVAEARPEGQRWAAERIAGGDDECAANQRLRLQNPDLLSEILDTPFWISPLGEELAPRTFVDRIDVPVFVAGAWQDEQTGGRFPTMLDRFTSAPAVYASLVNGLHTEAISPSILPRYVEFLDLYVAERTPSLDVLRVAAPLLGQGIFGTTDFELPADRFAGLSHAEALAAFEADPPIEVLFEQGAADGFAPGSPMARFAASFDAWPVPTAEATTWHLGQGTLAIDGDPSGTSEYVADPDAVPATFYTGSSSAIWRADVEYDWQEPPAATVASFLTEPLVDDVVVVGSGSVDLWLRTDAGDTDVEVTVSEVRPDGTEVYVQSGWLRASRRALDDASSTELRPVHTHLEADAAPLPGDAFELMRVELYPFAHPFRAGSQLRLTVDAPGGNRAVWAFDTIANGERVTIAHDADHPSRLVLPVVAGVDVPAGVAACGALRGQPCRPFAP